MTFQVIYPETAFVGKGGNTIKPRKLIDTVAADAAITTNIEMVRVANKGTGSIPDVDDPTGRTWAFEFEGSGPLTAPETSALDAIVAAHDGLDPPADSPAVGGTASQVWTRLPAGGYGWTTPAAASGAVETSYRLASNFNRSSTTAAAVTGWDAIPLTAGKRHRVRIRAVHRVLTGGHAAGRIGINCANTPADLWADATFHVTSRASGTTSLANEDRNNTVCATSGNIPTSNSDRITVYEAMFTAHASGGNMEVIWAAASSGQDATLMAGSIMTLTVFP